MIIRLPIFLPIMFFIENVFADSLFTKTCFISVYTVILHNAYKSNNQTVKSTSELTVKAYFSLTLLMITTTNDRTLGNAKKCIQKCLFVVVVVVGEGK